MDHDHAPALMFLLSGAPLVIIAIAAVDVAARRGWAPARATMLRIEHSTARTQAAALCLFTAGVIHIGLVPGHVGEPLVAASFLVAGVAFIALAVAAFTRRPWRIAAVFLLGSVLAAYAVTRAVGYEGLDALGVASCAVELLALGLLLIRPRNLRARWRAYASPYR